MLACATRSRIGMLVSAVDPRLLLSCELGTAWVAARLGAPRRDLWYLGVRTVLGVEIAIVE